MGNAIDGLLNDSYGELQLLVIVVLCGLVIGILRRVYDTRAYGRIYQETASEIIEAELQKDASVSQMTAHANFVSEFTSFFEHLLPAALIAGVMVLGSIIILSVISPLLGMSTLAVAIIVGVIFFTSRIHIQRLNAGLNDVMESQVEKLSTRNIKKIGAHFKSLVRWRVRLSDLEARNFGGAYFLALSLLIFAIYILIAVEGKSAGQAFAGLVYILQFIEAAVVLPFIYQSFLRTKEISERVSKNQT